MTCPGCQQDNPLHANFCLAWGVPLRRTSGGRPTTGGKICVTSQVGDGSTLRSPFPCPTRMEMNRDDVCGSPILGT